VDKSLKRLLAVNACVILTVRKVCFNRKRLTVGKNVNTSINNILDDVLGYLRVILSRAQRTIILALTVIFVAAPLAILSQTTVSAVGQVEPRELVISSAQTSAVTTYKIYFLQATNTQPIQGVTIQACTVAVGTCSGSTTTVPTWQTSTVPTLANFSGTPSGIAYNTSASSPVTCSASAPTGNGSVVCFTFTDATNQTTSCTSATILTACPSITLTGETNPTTAVSFYLRIITYNSTTINTTNEVDAGNVAGATTSNFLVSATVQEQLTFCVGAADGTSATVEVFNYSLAACGSLAAPSLNLGTLSAGNVNVSPVPVVNGGDTGNAVAELTTNAFNGTTISMQVVQGTGTNDQYDMRIQGATCVNDSTTTQPCLNAVGTTPATINPGAGTPYFGMTATGINCHNVGSAYTCTAASHNLTINSSGTNFLCIAGDSTSFNTVDTGGPQSATTSCKYAWDDSNTIDTVASSSTVVGGEGLIMEFAAMPAITTPTGSYTVQANYIASPDF
jgi:hypothetical protein